MARENMKLMLRENSQEQLHTVSQYIDWAQRVSRNVNEYEFLISIKDDYDRALIINNCDLFLRIQSLLKVKSPYLNQLSFDQILNYVYSNRVYFEIWYNGFYFFDSNVENLPTDQDLKNFIRLHFDAKKINGSTLDKIIYWIKEGWSLDRIIHALKHYFDHKKMYQASKIMIENLDCESFLELGEEQKFNIFKNTYKILHKFSEKTRQKIMSDNELTTIFTKIVHLYMKYSKNTYNINMFEKILKKESTFSNLIDFLSILRDSISGFNFDLEVKEIRETNNPNIKILADEPYFFIYQVIGRETLKKYGSPHWCIVTHESQYNSYVKPGFEFYIVLQRHPISKPNFKLGVTIDPKSKDLIKHSFNYDDNEHFAELEQYRHIFGKKNIIHKIFKNLFKKKSYPKYTDTVLLETIDDNDVINDQYVEDAMQAHPPDQGPVNQTL